MSDPQSNDSDINPNEQQEFEEEEEEEEENCRDLAAFNIGQGLNIFNGDEDFGYFIFRTLYRSKQKIKGFFLGIAEGSVSTAAIGNKIGGAGKFFVGAITQNILTLQGLIAGAIGFGIMGALTDDVVVSRIIKDYRNTAAAGARTRQSP